MVTHLQRLVIAVSLVLAAMSHASAETPTAAPQASIPLPVPRPASLLRAPEPAQAPATVSPQVQAQPPRAKGVPDDYKLAMLIRTSLIALNQANITGNYSVLRDLGSPAFHRANNPSRLAEAFANLRIRQINLEPVLVVEPKIAEPFINDLGMLRIKGFFPTQPEQVNFEMAYEKVENEWQLFALSVTTSVVGPVGQTTAQ